MKMIQLECQYRGRGTPQKTISPRSDRLKQGIWKYFPLVCCAFGFCFENIFAERYHFLRPHHGRMEYLLRSANLLGGGISDESEYIMLTLKQHDNLVLLAHNFLDAELTITTEKKHALSEFLTSALSRNPDRRNLVFDRHLMF